MSEQRFKNIETNEIVKIVGNNDKFYTLNNGMKMVKELFTKTYVAIESQSVETTTSGINVEDFLNTKTQIKIEVPKTATQPFINESVNIVNDTIVDPIDFLHNPAPIQGLDVLNNINTNKIVDQPNGTVVRVIDPNQPLESKPVSETEKQKLLNQYNNLASQNGINGKMIDENDDSSIDQFLNNGKPEQKQKKLDENGLTIEQEILRQEQIKINGVDPFVEKIRKYREQNNTNMNNQVILEEDKTNNSLTEKRANTQPIQEDSSHKLFSAFKRNYEVNINLSIKDYISNPQFIKIMADGLEGDIVKYFSEQIWNKFISDTQKFKDEIYNQLYREVYNKDKNSKPKRNYTKKDKKLE